VKKSIFQKVEETLKRAFPELIKIPWDKYGEGIVVTDNSVKKYQAFMVTHVPAGTDFVCARMFGDLPDRDKSFMTVVKKLNALEQNSYAWASIELRDPPRIWGGAVRNRVRESWGLTGLPELADHIVMTKTLYYCGEMSRSRHDRLLDSNYPGITAARAHVRMSDESYKRLVWLIDDIILVASM